MPLATFAISLLLYAAGVLLAVMGNYQKSDGSFALARKVGTFMRFLTACIRSSRISKKMKGDDVTSGRTIF